MSLKLADLAQWNVGAVVLVLEQLTMYYMTSLRSKNEFEVKFEKSMHSYNATLVH